MFRKVTKSSFSRGVGILIVLLAAAGLDLARSGTFGLVLTGIPWWSFGLLASAGGILFFLGPMLFGSVPARPLSVKRSPEALFLYLRPFELDARSFLQLTVGASAGAVVYLELLKGLWWPLTFLPLIVNINKEQNFQEAFSAFGEFIAFGRPHEWLKPLGASRVYAQEDWRQEVRHFMSLARVVVIRPGASESIQWEIEQLPGLVPPERIVFYLKFRGWKRRKERAYQSFRDHLQSRCPTKLPEQLGRTRFLLFDASWHAHFVEEANRPAQLIHQLFSRKGDITRDNLRPILKALELELPDRPNSLINNLVTLMLWIVAFVCLGLVLVSILLAAIQVTSALTLFFVSQRP